MRLAALCALALLTSCGDHLDVKPIGRQEGRAQTAITIRSLDKPGAEIVENHGQSQTVRVHVEQKNPDESTGPVVLPETNLVRGETRAIPWRSALYISAEPRQNLDLEINGKRYPMPSDSSRGQVLAP